MIYEVTKSQDGTVQHGLRISLDKPSTKKGTIQVECIASSLNYRDYLASRGNVGVARRFPYVPGVDMFGRVTETASKRFKTGDLVCIISASQGDIVPGGWSTSALINNQKIFKVNDIESGFRWMAIGTAGLAAALAVQSLIDHLGSRSNEKIVITGASGGVGSIASIILKKIGFQVVAVTSNQKKVKFINSLGINEIISFENFISSAKFNLLREEYIAGIDCLGGHAFSSMAKKIKTEGILVSAGQVAGQDINDLTVLPFLMRAITITGTGAEIASMRRKRRAMELLDKTLTDLDLKKLVHLIKMEGISKALNEFAEQKSFGRFVIKIGD